MGSLTFSLKYLSPELQPQLKVSGISFLGYFRTLIQIILANTLTGNSQSMELNHFTIRGINYLISTLWNKIDATHCECL